jgi:hypothetical protein
MIITSWNFEALENGYFMVGDISLSGLAALCVTGGGGFFFETLGKSQYCGFDIA